MGLLRKHIRDGAGRRIPLYRTGLWPLTMPHEGTLPRATREAVLARVPARGARLLGWLGFALVWAALAWFGARSMVSGRLLGVVIALALLAGGLHIASRLIDCWTGFGLARPAWLCTEMLVHHRCPSCAFPLVENADRRTCAECGAIWLPPAHIATGGS